MAFLAITSEYVPPNPRMLITAFPAIMVVARYARGRLWTLLIWANAPVAGRAEHPHLLGRDAAALTRAAQRTGPGSSWTWIAAA